MRYDIDKTAPTRNVTRFLTLTRRLLGRGMDDLGFGVFYGPSGYGKTVAAMDAAIRHSCHFVRMASTWSTKKLADEITHKLGLPPRSTANAALTDIVEQLTLDPNRPLIIDEADYLVKRDLIDFVRDILDMSKTPVILIGEELLPEKLRRFERAHNRVLDFVQALPTDLAEARMFAKLRARDVAIGDDLLARFVEAGEGRARRIAKNIDDAKELARSKGLTRIGLADWGDKAFFDGQAPKRRAA